MHRFVQHLWGYAQRFACRSPLPMYSLFFPSGRIKTPTEFGRKIRKAWGGMGSISLRWRMYSAEVYHQRARGLGTRRFNLRPFTVPPGLPYPSLIPFDLMCGSVPVYVPSPMHISCGDMWLFVSGGKLRTRGNILGKFQTVGSQTLRSAAPLSVTMNADLPVR